MQPSGSQLVEIAGLIDAGAIKPVIDKGFPLRQAQQAIEYSETGRARGKIVISVKV